MDSNRKFFISLLFLAIVASGLTLLLKQLMPQFVTSFWWALVIMFTVVNIIVYLLTMKMKKNDLGKFNNFYMLTTVVKLMFYLSVMTIYSLTCREDSRAFIITFLIYYLCFTVFETIILSKKNK